MTTTTNAETLQQYKSSFFIVKQMLAFASGANLVREVKNYTPNFKRIALQCFTL